MTNAKKSKQQRIEGTRQGPRKAGEGRGSTGLWIGLGVAAIALVVIAVVFGGSNSSNGTSGTDGVAPDGSVSIARDSGGIIAAGDPIPEWSAPALDGSGTITWSQYVGKPTVLAVWAPWCPHCQAELPRLSAAVGQHPGVQLTSITTAVGQEPGPTPSQYMSDNGLTFPVAMDDANRTLMTGLGVQGFPTTYFVDSSGNVVRSTEGEIPPDELESILSDLETK
jgi:thiol-disulfide isomerase/thioredoxin